MANLEAYSLEIGEFITAERANELHWLGILEDQKQFICGNEKCNGKVTCSNMTKPREKMKKRPHFTNVGEHACTKKKIVGISEESTERKSRIKSDTVEFKLNFSNYKPITGATKTKIDDGDEIEKLKKLRRKGNGKITIKSKYGLLMSLVNDFREYRKGNLLDKRFIETEEEKISFEEMFLEFEALGVNDVAERKVKNRVYYGKGKIKKSFNNSNQYIIYFEPIEDNGKTIIRTAVILEDALNNSTQFIKKELEKLLSVNDKVLWFIYGKPRYKKTDNDDEYLSLYINKINALYFE